MRQSILLFLVSFISYIKLERIINENLDIDYYLNMKKKILNEFINY